MTNHYKLGHLHHLNRLALALKSGSSDFTASVILKIPSVLIYLLQG